MCIIISYRLSSTLKYFSLHMQMKNREFERHLRDDTVLNNISKMFISLQEKDIRTINTFLQPVCFFA